MGTIFSSIAGKAHVYITPFTRTCARNGDCSFDILVVNERGFRSDSQVGAEVSRIGCYDVYAKSPRIPVHYLKVLIE